MLSPRRLWQHARALPRSIAAIWHNPSNMGDRVGRTLLFIGMRVFQRARREPIGVTFGRASRIWIAPGRGGSMRALLAPMPDYPEMRVWEDRLKPGDLFIDVGAHVGFYTVFAAELGADVIAIEPQPELVRYLSENLLLNRLAVEVHQLALSDRSGEMFLGGGADPSQHALSDSPTGVRVRVGKLDEIIGNRAVAGVKIDVEGGERLVLAGAPRALSEGRIALMQLEWNQTSERNFGESREPLASLLAQHGYALFRPTVNGELREVLDPPHGPDVFAVLKRPG